MAAGVLEAVYKELARANNSHNIQLHQTRTGSYVQILARPSAVVVLLQAARAIAEELISDDSVDPAKPVKPAELAKSVDRAALTVSAEKPSIFQEPPIEIDKDFHVALEINPSSNDARPKLQLGQVDLISLELPEEFGTYTTKLAHCVYKGLKNAGRLDFSLTPRVHLGHCMLRTYPQGKSLYSYKEFHTMIKNPRASAWLKTW